MKENKRAPLCRKSSYLETRIDAAWGPSPSRLPHPLLTLSSLFLLLFPSSSSLLSLSLIRTTPVSESSLHHMPWCLRPSHISSGQYELIISCHGLTPKPEASQLGEREEGVGNLNTSVCGEREEGVQSGRREEQQE